MSRHDQSNKLKSLVSDRESNKGYVKDSDANEQRYEDTQKPREHESILPCKPFALTSTNTSRVSERYDASVKTPDEILRKKSDGEEIYFGGMPGRRYPSRRTFNCAPNENASRSRAQGRNPEFAENPETSKISRKASATHHICAHNTYNIEKAPIGFTTVHYGRKYKTGRYCTGNRDKESSGKCLTFSNSDRT